MEGFEMPNPMDTVWEYALAGRREEALSRLEMGIEQGWRGYELWDDWRFAAYFDFGLDSIRDDPRFRAAIAVIEADMAQQLENVRAMQRRGEIPTLEQVKEMIASKRESG